MEVDPLLANAPEVGGNRVLPPCVILNRLGKGGMGVVYRARHLNFNFDVAVKVLLPERVSEDPTFISRFRREGQITAKINHSNVLRVYDILEWAGIHYIVMELVIGDNATKRVQRRGALPIGEAVQIVYEAAQGLGEAHREGVVHRDIKPDNLMISNEGKVKVADLGLAKPQVSSGNSMLSMAGQIMGTPQYMPPEQWETPMVGPQADVWALGSTLYFLLAGKHAYAMQDDNYARLMKQILMQPFPDIRAARQDVPDGLVAVLQKATAKEAADRFADCGELAEAIENLGMKRTSLRTVVAAPEAGTMVSPASQNFDGVRQWLRDDANTRQLHTPQRGSGLTPRPQPQPPSGGGTMPVTPPAPTPPAPETPSPNPVEPPPSPKVRETRTPSVVVVPEPIPPRGGTAIVSRPPGQLPSSGKRSPLLVAAVLAVVAAGGYGAFLATQGPTPPPVTDPLAKLIQLERESQFDLAIEELRRLASADPKLRDDARLARLHDQAAQQFQSQMSWRKALERMSAGLAIESKPERLAQQKQLRTAAAGAAAALLDRRSPKDPVPKTQPVRFLGQLAADFVRELKLEDQRIPIATKPDFDVQVNLGGKAEATMTAVLADGGEEPLPGWRVAYAEEAGVTDANLQANRGTIVVPPTPTPTPTPPLPAAALRFERIGAETPSGGPVERTAGGRLKIGGKLQAPNDARPRFDNCRWSAVGASVQRPILGNDGTFRAELFDIAPGKQTIVVKAELDGFTAAEQRIEVVNLTAAPRVTIKPVGPVETKAPDVTFTVEVDGYAEQPAATVGGQPVELVLRSGNDGEVRTYEGKLKLQADDTTLEVRARNVVGTSQPSQQTWKWTAKKTSIRGWRLSVGGVSGPNSLTAAQVNYVNSSQTDLIVTAEGDELELQCGDRKFINNKVSLADLLRPNEVAPLTITAKGVRGDDTESLSVYLDTRNPTVTVDPVPPFKPGAEIVLSGRYQDASKCRELKVGTTVVPVDDAGQWRYTLTGPQTRATLEIVAFDQAGNPGRTTKDLEPQAATVTPPKPNPVDSNPQPLPVAKEQIPSGFAKPNGAKANAAGWLDQLRHVETGILLIALGWRPDGGKPSLYMASKETSEAELSGEGSANKAATDIPARTINNDFLNNRGRLLALPRPSDIQLALLEGNALIRGLNSGPGEWLQPESGGYSDTWPVHGIDGAQTFKITTMRNYLGFRTVYRP